MRSPTKIPVLGALLAVTALAVLAACGDAGADGSGAPDGEPAAQAVPDTAGPAADTADAGSDRADRDADRRPTTRLRVAGHEVRAEVADSESERRRGLMGRDSLPEDHGMLFVYPEQRTLSFWMRNTKIPLDIAFADRRGIIVDVQTMEPESEELHRSGRPAKYALEMAAGWFEAHGVRVGDQIEF